MPYIQFCGAGQALSIGIWFDLNRKNFSRKNSQKVRGKFCSFSVNFLGYIWGVSQVGPFQLSRSTSLDCKTLDYSMVN